MEEKYYELEVGTKKSYLLDVAKNNDLDDEFDLITDVWMELFERTEDDPDSEDTVVLKLWGKLISMVGCMNEEIDPFGVFDEDSQELCDLYKTMFDPKVDLYQPVDPEHKELLDEGAPSYNIFYIRDIEVPKEYRGKGFATTVLKFLTKLVRDSLGYDVSFIVLQAIPQDKEDDPMLQEKLYSLYKRCGFIQYGDTNFFYKNTSFRED